MKNTTELQPYTGAEEFSTKPEVARAQIALLVSEASSLLDDASTLLTIESTFPEPEDEDSTTKPNIPVEISETLREVREIYTRYEYIFKTTLLEDPEDGLGTIEPFTQIESGFPLPKVADAIYSLNDTVDALTAALTDDRVTLLSGASNFLDLADILTSLAAKMHIASMRAKGKSFLTINEKFLQDHIQDMSRALAGPRTTLKNFYEARLLAMNTGVDSYEETVTLTQSVQTIRTELNTYAATLAKLEDSSKE